MRSLSWEPSLPRLSLVTGQSGLYLWTPVGSLVTRIPQVERGETEGMTELSWSQRGTLCLGNSRHVILCKVTHSGKQKEEEQEVEEESELDLEPSREETTS